MDIVLFFLHKYLSNTHFHPIYNENNGTISNSSNHRSNRFSCICRVRNNGHTCTRVSSWNRMPPMTMILMTLVMVNLSMISMVTFTQTKKLEQKWVNLSNYYTFFSPFCIRNFDKFAVLWVRVDYLILIFEFKHKITQFDKTPPFDLCPDLSPI